MTVKQDVLDRWTVENATETYGVRNWSGGHFEIGPDGKVAAMLQCGDGRTRVPIYDLIQELKASGIYSPVLLRFSDIVRSRIEHLHGAFSKAIQEAGLSRRVPGRLPDQGQPAPGSRFRRRDLRRDRTATASKRAARRS
jgi:arginine decarboxylase